MHDPRSVTFDPMVTNIWDLHKGEYIVIEEVLTLPEIRQRWPGRGQLVKADKTLGLPTRPHKGVQSPTERISNALFGKASKSSETLPRSKVRTYWLKDPTFNTETNRPAFAGGRMVIRGGEDIILVDQPNQYWDGIFPIDGFNWDIDPDHGWGRGEIQKLTRLNEAIDRSGDGFVRNFLLNNNTVVIGDADALDPSQWGNLTNLEGLVIKKRPGRELRREPPPVLPPEFAQIPAQLIELGSMLTGMREVTQGVRPGGTTSGVAIEGLQASALTLVRRVARNLEATLSGVGQKLVSRIFQFYDKDRVMMMLGETEAWKQYAFLRDGLLKELRTGSNGNLLPPEDFRKRLNNAFRDFRFLIRPGSSLAASRIQRGLQAVNLFQLGLIDDEEVLRTVEWPNRDEVLQRARVKQAAQGNVPRTGSAQAQRKTLSSMEELGGL